MTLLAAIALTAATLAALLVPLLRAPNGEAPSRADHALAVYRNQLAELDRDAERGMASPEETKAARLEIHRRILASAEDGDAAPADNRKLDQIAAIVVVVIISIGSWQLYAALGSPNLPDRPFAARQNDADMQLSAAAEMIAAEIDARPSAEGYRRLGEIYYVLHSFSRAAAAFQEAIGLDGNDAATWSRLGESLVMQNDGAVVMDAQNAFHKALALDKKEPRARFYIGIAYAQIGEFKKAVAIWRDLEKSVPPDAPWLGMVKANIAAYSKTGGFDPASAKPVGP